MAHENLKFNLKLKFEKNPKDKKWQPIYGAQHHGTFYMIYIKFNSKSTGTKEDKTTFYKYNCSFRIQNYRGAITMGLSGKPSLKHGFDNHHKSDVMYLNIDVTPFTKNDYINDVELKESNQLTKDLVLVSKVNCTPPPENIFSNKGKNIKTIHKNLDNSIYIDPYQYTRDGDHFREVSTREAGSTSPFPSIQTGGSDNNYGFCLADVSIID